MAVARAAIEVPGSISEAEALWYDVRRWPAWVDGLGHVLKVDDTWPQAGARVSLELDYKLKPGVLLRALVDLLFVRRAMADSMRRTLGRFGRELAADQELLR